MEAHQTPAREPTVYASPLVESERQAKSCSTVAFRDADGSLWQVSERVERRGRDRVRSLVFETDRTARRVHDFPDDWSALGPGDLAALSWHR